VRKGSQGRKIILNLYPLTPSTSDPETARKRRFMRKVNVGGIKWEREPFVHIAGPAHRGESSPQVAARLKEMTGSWDPHHFQIVLTQGQPSSLRTFPGPAWTGS
jgi:hypothetical protein